MRRSKVKWAAFFVLFCFPTLVLSIVLVPFLQNLWSLNYPDHQLLAQLVADHLETRPIEEAAHPPEDIASKAGFDPQSDNLVFFLGGSSLVCISNGSDDDVFPNMLDQRIEDYRIVNLGDLGLDSFSLVRKLDEVLKRTTPKKIIVYTGHNDYTNAYRTAIKPKFSIFDGTIFPHFLRWHRRYRQSPDWHLINTFDPRAHHFLDSLGLINIDYGEFRKYEILIERGLEGCGPILSTLGGIAHADTPTWGTKPEWSSLPGTA